MTDKKRWTVMKIDADNGRYEHYWVYSTEEVRLVVYSKYEAEALASTLNALQDRVAELERDNRRMSLAEQPHINALRIARERFRLQGALLRECVPFVEEYLRQLDEQENRSAHNECDPEAREYHHVRHETKSLLTRIDEACEKLGADRKGGRA